MLGMNSTQLCDEVRSMHIYSRNIWCLVWSVYMPLVIKSEFVVRLTTTHACGAPYMQGPQISLCSVYSSRQGSPGKRLLCLLKVSVVIAAGTSTLTKCWESGLVQTEFSEHVWSSGSVGLQPGQHCNHFRDLAVSMQGAQFNHHIWSGGPFNHSANSSRGW